MGGISDDHFLYYSNKILQILHILEYPLLFMVIVS